MGPLFTERARAPSRIWSRPLPVWHRPLISAPPGWLVFPRYQAGRSLHLEPIAKPQAFIKLANNSFNYQLLGLQGFQDGNRLVATVDCYILSYSYLDEAIVH